MVVVAVNLLRADGPSQVLLDVDGLLDGWLVQPDIGLMGVCARNVHLGTEVNQVGVLAALKSCGTLVVAVANDVVNVQVVKDGEDLVLDCVTLVLITVGAAVFINEDLLLGGVESMAVHEGKQVVVVSGGTRVSDTVSDGNTLNVDLGLTGKVTLNDTVGQSRDVDATIGLTSNEKLSSGVLGVSIKELLQEDEGIFRSLSIRGLSIVTGGVGVREANASRALEVAKQITR
jgi:hypothetical protein